MAISMLEYEVGDLQCLEAFASKGMSIDDWIDSKREVIKFMRNRAKSVEHVHIDEIYPNGKPKKNKVVK